MDWEVIVAFIIITLFLGFFFLFFLFWLFFCFLCTVLELHRWYHCIPVLFLAVSSTFLCEHGYEKSSYRCEEIMIIVITLLNHCSTRSRERCFCMYTVEEDDYLDVETTMTSSWRWMAPHDVQGFSVIQNSPLISLANPKSAGTFSPFRSGNHCYFPWSPGVQN